MTYKTQLEARRAGRQALKLVATKGWKVKTWENMGWHWELVNEKGFLFLTPAGMDGDQFKCGLVMTKGRTGIPGYWYDPCVYWDPNVAVLAQLNIARGPLDDCTRGVKAAAKVAFPRE